MYLSNKVINLSKNKIVDYNISEKKDIIQNYIISFVKECGRNNLNPTAQDIIECFENCKIFHLSKCLI